MNPSDYLYAWSRHIGLRNEVLNISNIPQLSVVQPDIRLEGKLVVVSDSVQVRELQDQNEEGEYLDQ